MGEKPPPPYESKQVLRECHLEGCKETFMAESAAPAVWCTIAHRKADPEGGLEPLRPHGG